MIVNDYNITREQNRKMEESDQEIKRLGYEGAFRVKLQGPPRVVTLLKDCVALCKGLSGTNNYYYYYYYYYKQ